ncbi:DMT family transporter [Ramlibacter sp.]|uniref:DMT family transporter n=1 Tax=Ramlibacter sp. TaxID=1917967 RepID=UPI0017E87AA7|nr:DMT family transporter [Ramlibacter sp.]MBA2673894.1 DMT family transporter [Ramlibacter sp.]
MSSRQLPPGGIPTWALYLATVATGGLTWFVTTYQLGIVPYRLSLAYRFGISAAVLLLLARATGAVTRLRAMDHVLVALQGGLIFLGSFSLIYLGLARLTSGLVALLFSSVLIFNVVNSAVFLRRRIAWTVVAGAGLGALGLAVVFGPEAATLTLGDRRAVGILLVVGAAALFSAGNMLSARLQAAGVPSLQGTGLAMAYGAVLLAATAAAMGTPLAFDLSLPYLASLLYLAVFGSVIGYGAYFMVVGRIGPERAAYSIVMTPVFALVVSTALEGFAWSPRILAGVAIVAAGNVVILSRTRSRTAGPRGGEGHDRDL